MASEPPQPTGIGEMLKDARQRAGLDIGAVEQQTKIRTRYLRALESEDWEALPGEVYVRSFLRTYSQLLGLDADAILDQYRSGEGARAGGHPIAEPMLRTRRRADQTGRDWAPGGGLAIGAVVVILLVVLFVIGRGGGNDGETGNTVTNPQAGKHGGSHANNKPQEPAPPPKLKLSLIAADAVPVCLLNGDGKKLLDETMSPGERKDFDSYTYRLRFTAGLDLPQIKLLANGDPVDLGPDPSGPVEYEIDNDGSVGHAATLTSTGCP